MPTKIVRSLKPKAALGNPKAAIAAALAAGALTVHTEGDSKGLPVNGQSVILGHIYGVASEFYMHERNSPTPGGEIVTERWPALRGDFEAVPVNGGDASRSPVIFLPDHIARMVGTTLESAGEGASVHVAFEVSAEINSKSSAGFVWQYQPKTELTPAKDPLAELRALATGKAEAPAITDQSEGGEAGPETALTGGETTGAKGKGRKAA